MSNLKKIRFVQKTTINILLVLKFKFYFLISKILFIYDFIK